MENNNTTRDGAEMTDSEFAAHLEVKKAARALEWAAMIARIADEQDEVRECHACGSLLVDYGAEANGKCYFCGAPCPVVRR